MIFLRLLFTVNYHHTFHQSGSRQENLKFVIQNILMLWNRSCCKSTVKENPQVSWHFRKTKELYFTLSQESFAPARRVFETDIPARVQYVLFFEIFVSLMLSLFDVKKITPVKNTQIQGSGRGTTTAVGHSQWGCCPQK